MAVKCMQSGKCFARLRGYCSILTEEIPEDKKCAFQKEERYVYNGKYYPFDPCYVEGGSPLEERRAVHA